MPLVAEEEEKKYCWLYLQYGKKSQKVFHWKVTHKKSQQIV